MQDLLNKLLTLRDAEDARRQAVLDTARELGYRKWTDDKTGELGRMYRTSQAAIKALDARVREQREEIARSSHNSPLVQAIRAGGGTERKP